MDLSTKRTILAAAGVAGAALALAFFLGRWSAPESVRIESVTLESSREMRFTGVVLYVASSSRQAKDQRRELVYVWYPDGKVEAREQTELREESEQRTVALAQREDLQLREHVHTRFEVETREAPRPRWRLGPQLNYELGGRVVVGAALERRIGPVWVGVWAGSDPALERAAGGVLVRFEL